MKIDINALLLGSVVSCWRNASHKLHARAHCCIIHAKWWHTHTLCRLIISYKFHENKKPSERRTYAFLQHSTNSELLKYKARIGCMILGSRVSCILANILSSHIYPFLHDLHNLCIWSACSDFYAIHTYTHFWLELSIFVLINVKFWA